MSEIYTEEVIDNPEVTTDIDPNSISDERLAELLESDDPVSLLSDSKPEEVSDTTEEVLEPEDAETEVEPETPQEDDDTSYLKKQLGRQGNEIGDLRKQNQNLLDLVERYIKTPNEPGEDEDGEWDDPRKVARDEYSRMQAEEAIAKEKANGYVEQTKSAILELHPDFSEDAVWEAIKSDGVSDEVVQGMKESLWTSDPLLIHAQYQRGILMRQVKELQAKNAELAAESREKAKRVKSKIAKAARSNSPKTVGSGNHTPVEDTITKDDISNLSYDQLEELLKRKG